MARHRHATIARPSTDGLGPRSILNMLHRHLYTALHGACIVQKDLANAIRQNYPCKQRAVSKLTDGNGFRHHGFNSQVSPMIPSIPSHSSTPTLAAMNLSHLQGGLLLAALPILLWAKYFLPKPDRPYTGLGTAQPEPEPVPGENKPMCFRISGIPHLWK